MLAHLPDYVVAAGDWHTDCPWGRGVIAMLPQLLPRESPRIVIHAGDLGVYPDGDGQYFLDGLNKSLERNDGHLYFVDGNHEDFVYLHELAGTVNPSAPVSIRPRITWLPRGFRWIWHGRVWLALGGAVSVDRVDRTFGVDWFPEEEITEAQTQRVMDGGRADVMLCHDAPAAVPLKLPRGRWPQEDLHRSQQHRERLQAITEVVQPSYLIHGHYHLEHDTLTRMPYGLLMATGLHKNNAIRGNYRVLNVREMQYELV